MKAQPQQWHAVSVTVRAEYVEAAEFAFNSFDSLGTEVDLLTDRDQDLCAVRAYFTGPQDEQAVDREMRNAARVYGLPDDIDFVVRQAVIENQDWLAEWKKYWKPVTVGRFITAAPWHEVDDTGRFVIRIEPNMAFGTGTHETTRLCLDAINRYYEPGQSFLDVGTGTGILAIAAAMLSPNAPKIMAVDNDPEAVAIARTNARLNGVADLIDIRTGTIEAAEQSFDLVCANLTADVILPILPELLEKTNRSLVLSGILAEQRDMIEASIPKRFTPVVERDGEWIAVIIRKS